MSIEEYDGAESDEATKPSTTGSWSWKFASLSEGFARYLSEALASFAERVEWATHGLAQCLWLLVTPSQWRSKQNQEADEEEATGTVTESHSLTDSFERLFGRVVFSLDLLLRVAYAKLVPQSLLRWRDRTLARRRADLEIVEVPEENTDQIPESVLPSRWLWPLFWIFDFSWDGFDFVGEWWYSRDHRKLFWAVPAILLAVPLCVVWLLAVQYSKSDKLEHYLVALSTAEEMEDDDTAAFVNLKLGQLGYQRLEEIEFHNAMQLAQAGDNAGAYERMKLLAPVDRPGFLAAHVWIAASLLDERIQAEPVAKTGGSVKPDGLRAVDWELLETHANLAIQISPDNVLARRLRVEAWLHRRELADAAEEMAAIVKEYPDLHATLASTYRQLGDESKARFHARQTIHLFSQLVEAQRSGRALPDADASTDGTLPLWHDIAGFGNGLSPLGYLRLAEAYAIVGDMEAELIVLQLGSGAHPDDPRLESTLKEVFSGRLRTADLNHPAAQGWIERLCQLEPDHPELIRRLVSGLVEENPQVQELVDYLHGKGLLTSRFFHAAADAFMVRAQYPQALHCYQLTLKLNPRQHLAWNNLAWIRANVDPVNFVEALDASNRAIEYKTDDPRLRDTRGQIFAKLHRWEEAIDDLELALGGSIPNAAEAHASLATCYEALGQTEQAAAHRQLSK